MGAEGPGSSRSAMALREPLGGAEVPPPVHAIWLGHKPGSEMLLGGKFLSGEEFLMEAVTVPKLESNWVCQQVAVVCDCG